MRYTVSEFVVKSNILRDALLLCVIANCSLVIRTAAPKAISRIPGSSPFRIVDNDLNWQQVDSSERRPRETSDRRLARFYDGNPINVLTSVDPFCKISKVLAQTSADENAPSAESMHVLMMLPGTTVPEAVMSRMAYAVDLRDVSPAEVKELIDLVMQGDQFSPDRVEELRAEQRAVTRDASDAFINRVSKAVRATRPDTVEFMDRVSIGIMPTFGYGISPRSSINLLHICAAGAVVAGREYVTEADLVQHFSNSIGHAIIWGAAEPNPGALSALTQIAEWSVSI